ncbi:MAG: wax ester/triacylglycerol synthase family O-acyltransferase [Deltaproteobacteria bacterium]|nr:wax ester/triacylglycerol synthase family O-acyltransferase [Deltaproteobacteria bacterium]
MDDPVNLMVITGFWEFEETLDYNRLFATLEARLAPFPRFKKKVMRPKSGLGLPKWVTDKHYDLRSHLHRIALPEPGDKNELQDMISQLMTTGLDYNKPLWDIHLIENYQKGCVLFFRLHHCIADGIALMHVLHSMADTDPDAPWPKPKAFEKKGSVSRSPLFSFNTMISSAKEAVEKGRKISKTVFKEIEKISSDTGPLKFMAKAAANLPADVIAVLSKHTAMTSDPNTAFKGKLGVQKKVAWTDPVPLDKVKTLGRAINSATLNDVLIATVTGSMRRYLKTRNTPINELDLRVTVPVNIRKPGTEFTLGNKFSLVFLSLPVFLKDPVLRLKEVKRRMDKLKVSAEPYVNFGLLNAIGYLPTTLAQKAAQLFGNKASGVLTNVPGPRKPLYFAGKKISNIMFWVPRSGVIGLGISILSYNGNVTIGIASDNGLMPDPETLLAGFEDEFNYLIDLVQSGKINEGPLVLHDRFEEKRSENPGISSEKKAMTSGRDQCRAMTKSGKQCRNKAINGQSFCHRHRQASEEENLLDDVAQIMRGLVG